MERERVVRQKVAASTFARGYLSGIVTTVFDRLQAAGYFYDPIQREVEESFMPWLKDAATAYLSQGVLARQVCVYTGPGQGRDTGTGLEQSGHITFSECE